MVKRESFLHFILLFFFSLFKSKYHFLDFFFLFFDCLTKVVFPAPHDPCPPMQDCSAMTNNAPWGVREWILFLFFLNFLLPPRVLHGGGNRKEKTSKSSSGPGLCQVSKLMGGGHQQITLTHRHSSSLPHTG